VAAAVTRSDHDRVLLTGAGGLIGAWAQRHWPESGPEMVPVRAADVDLLQPGAAAGLLDRLRPSHVVHLAWSASGQAGYRHSDDNARWVASTLDLHTACRDAGVRLWLTGTVVDVSPSGTDLYTRAKADLRAAVESDIDAGVIGWLRPFYVIDETRGRPAVVAQAVEAARRGETLGLLTPDARHDFVHASDVGSAVVHAVLGGRTGYLPVGSGRLHRVADLVAALGARWQATTDTAPTTTHADAAADIRWLEADGWTPTRTRELFADG
jgi:nucleoside-diphosphate-sugar epimerase